MYTAIVISTNDSVELLKRFIPKFPHSPKDKLAAYAHHVTLSLGKIADKTLIGKQVTFICDAYGFTEKALALRVILPKMVTSTNRQPHLTIVVNSSANGKPKDSNGITGWTTIDPITLTGVITECQ